VDTGNCVRIIFVRHGLTAWNREGRYQGQTDISLSEEGVGQAMAVARRLSTERIDRVYSSDLKRALMTAEHIAAPHGVTVITDRRLRELNFGRWEGLTYEEIGKGWPELQKSWIADPVHFTAPEGESAGELEKRVFEALQDIRQQLLTLRKENAAQGDESTPVGVIVSHGGVIRWLVALLAGSEFGSKPIQQASISICEISDAGLNMVTWNDSAHLQVGEKIATRPI
jgi:broad specificity phosphatase PhoE